jgi:O-antigen/teichoic acid export membrane protein
LGAFYKLNTLVAILIGVPIAIFSSPIVNLLFGVEYNTAAPILALMTMRLAFTHIGAARGIYMINENLMKYAALTMVIGTIANVVLNYFLIPHYEGLGATAASLVSFATTVVFIDFFYSKARGNAKLMLKSAFTCASLFRRRSWVL